MIVIEAMRTRVLGRKRRMSTIRRLSAGLIGVPVRRPELQLKPRGLLKENADDRFDQKTKAPAMKFEWCQGFEMNGVAGGKPSLKGDGKGVFNVVSLNVKSNPEMPQDQVVHDVRRAARTGGIIGWQEIAPQRYRDAIAALPGFNHFMPKGLQAPISWKSKDWKRLDSGVELMHLGKPGISPHRSVAWVKLKNKETGETIIHMNTHLVSGAWNKAHTASDPWRKKMWHQHINRMESLIARFEKKGHPVTITGDFNRNHFRVFGNDVVYASGLRAGTHGPSTLDYVMNTRHEALAKVSNRVDTRFASDHNAVIVRYDLD